MRKLIAGANDKIVESILGYKIIGSILFKSRLTVRFFNLRRCLQFLVDDDGYSHGLLSHGIERLLNSSKEVLAQPVAEKFVGHIQFNFRVMELTNTDGTDPCFKVLFAQLLT